MTFFIFILLLTLFILFWLVLIYPAQKSAAILINSGPFILIALGCLLTAFRRGMIGIPMIFLGISWLRRIRSTRSSTFSGGQKSTVRSKNLEMELDHDTGEMDGRVLAGQMEGARLSHMDLEELLSLYYEISSDPDSAALLESFLDRYHSNWREHSDPGSFNGRDRSSGLEDMTKEQAYQILGLEPGASQEEIHQAWRRLIKGVHPDGGGSPFLTAKINAARDILMD